MKKLLILFIISTPLFAVKEYYSLSRSIRAQGMGGAFYGLSNDEYALFYNPAGLSLYNNESEGMLRINAQMAPKTLSALNTLTKNGSGGVSTIVTALQQYQGTPLYGAAGILPYYVRKNFAIGLLLADTKFNFAILGKEIDTEVDVTAISDSGLVIGYARSVVDPNLHIGLNTKLLARAGGKKKFAALDIAQNQSFNLNPKDIGGMGGGVDFDLGATYDLSSMPFGLVNRVSLVLSNLAASTFSISRSGGAPPGLSRTASLGYYTVFPGWKAIDNFHVLLDLAEINLGGESDPDYGQRVGSLFKHVNVGVEMPMSWFTLRTGFHQGYLSGGFGINLKYMKLDFATYAEELAGAPGRLGSRRFALTIAFGGGAPPAPPFSSVRESEVNTIHSAASNETPNGAEKDKLDPALEMKDAPKNP